MSCILFLCTGNSCRSQMAEGWARHLAGSTHQIASAGIEAHGLNPRALAVMLEVGVDITDQQSSTLDTFSLSDFDLLVTVCGDADERCPVLPAGVTKRHWNLADPARLTGTDEEILTGFRRSRDEIKIRVQRLLETLSLGQTSP